MLELRNVEISLAGRRLFAPVSFAVPAGDFVTVMGPSGCGKSTLLSYICGTVNSAFCCSGELLLAGESFADKPLEHRGVGILFQDALLFPHLNVEENLLFALSADIVGGRERREYLLERLGALAMEKLIYADVRTLSGGERARLGLQRSLLAKPKLLLLDEPFAALDQQKRESFRCFVQQQVKEQNIPALLVSHDPSDQLGKLYFLRGGKR